MEQNSLICRLARLLGLSTLAMLMGCGPRVIDAPKGGTMADSGPVYGFTMKTIDGKERKLSDYRGKVLLIVNVASKCGFTPQYEGLEALYRKYKDRGFTILGFPANDFLGQEPGTEEEIITFCRTKYDVTFDMFSKITVKGKDINPLYDYLVHKSPVPGDISWNFNKFLVDRHGNVVARFGSKVTPGSQEIAERLEKLLAE
jgi:glutathione peroxidase